MAGGLPTITSHRKMPERFWIPKTFAADGGARPNSGGTPFRQPCPAYPSTKGRKAPQERFSEENFPNLHFIRKRVSLKLSRQSLHQHRKNSQHTTSLDVLAEPNYYSKRVRTSSTRVFASHYDGNRNAKRNHDCVSRAGEFPREILRKERSGSRLRAPASLTHARRLDLLIPPPASTLQVFQFIRRFVLRDSGTQRQSNV